VNFDLPGPDGAVVIEVEESKRVAPMPLSVPRDVTSIETAAQNVESELRSR
jgi:hypothetical protein